MEIPLCTVLPFRSSISQTRTRCTHARCEVGTCPVKSSQCLPSSRVPSTAHGHELVPILSVRRSRRRRRRRRLSVTKLSRQRRQTGTPLPWHLHTTHATHAPHRTAPTLGRGQGRPAIWKSTEARPASSSAAAQQQSGQAPGETNDHDDKTRNRPADEGGDREMNGTSQHTGRQAGVCVCL